MLEHTALLELGQHRRRQIEDTLLALINGRTVPQIWLERVGFDRARPRFALIIEPAQLPGPDDCVIPLMRQLEISDKSLLLAQVVPQRLLVLVPVKPSGTPEQRLMTEQSPKRLQRHLPAAIHASIVMAVGQYTESNLRGCYESAFATTTYGRRESPHFKTHCYSDRSNSHFMGELSPRLAAARVAGPLARLAGPPPSSFVCTNPASVF